MTTIVFTPSRPFGYVRVRYLLVSMSPPPTSRCSNRCHDTRPSVNKHSLSEGVDFHAGFQSTSALSRPYLQHEIAELRFPNLRTLTATRIINDWAATPRCSKVSQRSLHNAPIFRLLLKVAVNGTHQCDFLNF